LRNISQVFTGNFFPAMGRGLKAKPAAPEILSAIGSTPPRREAGQKAPAGRAAFAP
jgi:hypothetical protein